MPWIERRRTGSRACLISILFASLAGVAQQATSPQSGAPSSPAAPTPAGTSPRFVVVIDAAHGGTDGGARLGERMLEKDLSLMLSVRLRSTLSAHGIAVITIRESDITIPTATRAGIANHATAAACITLHATASGSGVHLFTSSLAQAPFTRFMPWETAQAAYAQSSLRLSSEINSAMTHAEIPVTLGRTSLQPLDSFTCPAVAIEIAPPAKSESLDALFDPDYQTHIVTAITAAIEQWRSDWRQP